MHPSLPLSDLRSNYEKCESFTSNLSLHFSPSIAVLLKSFDSLIAFKLDLKITVQGAARIEVQKVKAGVNTQQKTQEFSVAAWCHQASSASSALAFPGVVLSFIAVFFSITSPESVQMRATNLNFILFIKCPTASNSMSCIFHCIHAEKNQFSFEPLLNSDVHNQIILEEKLNYYLQVFQSLASLAVKS